MVCFTQKRFSSFYVHSQAVPQLGKTVLVNSCMFEEVSVQYKFLLINHYRRNPVSKESVSAVSVMRSLPWPEKKIGKLKKRFISLKTRSKRERAVTWWNPAAQTRPVLDSSSFVTKPTLSRRTCLHFASSVLADRISCRVIAVFVFRKALFTVIMAPKRTRWW
jgi:hypothetical protein